MKGFFFVCQDEKSSLKFSDLLSFFGTSRAYRLSRPGCAQTHKHTHTNKYANMQPHAQTEGIHTHTHTSVCYKEVSLHLYLLSHTIVIQNTFGPLQPSIPSYAVDTYSPLLCVQTTFIHKEANKPYSHHTHKPDYNAF